MSAMANASDGESPGAVRPTVLAKVRAKHMRSHAVITLDDDENLISSLVPASNFFHCAYALVLDTSRPMWVSSKVPGVLCGPLSSDLRVACLSLTSHPPPHTLVKNHAAVYGRLQVGLESNLLAYIRPRQMARKACFLRLPIPEKRRKNLY